MAIGMLGIVLGFVGILIGAASGKYEFCLPVAALSAFCFLLHGWRERRSSHSNMALFFAELFFLLPTILGIFVATARIVAAPALLAFLGAWGGRNLKKWARSDAASQ
jgi:hypothetical protein